MHGSISLVRHKCSQPLNAEKDVQTIQLEGTTEGSNWGENSLASMNCRHACIFPLWTKPSADYAQLVEQDI